MFAKHIKKPSERFIDGLKQRGVSLKDCPACPIQPEWEHLPAIKAIRAVEKETGEPYHS